MHRIVPRRSAITGESLVMEGRSSSKDRRKMKRSSHLWESSQARVRTRGGTTTPYSMTTTGEAVRSKAGAARVSGTPIIDIPYTLSLIYIPRKCRCLGRARNGPERIPDDPTFLSFFCNVNRETTSLMYARYCQFDRLARLFNRLRGKYWSVRPGPTRFPLTKYDGTLDIDTSCHVVLDRSTQNL